MGHASRGCSASNHKSKVQREISIGMDGLNDDWKADYTITIIKIAHRNNRLTCRIPAHLFHLYVPHYHNNTIFFTMTTTGRTLYLH